MLIPENNESRSYWTDIWSKDKKYKYDTLCFKNRKKNKTELFLFILEVEEIITKINV